MIIVIIVVLKLAYIAVLMSYKVRNIKNTINGLVNRSILNSI